MSVFNLAITYVLSFIVFLSVDMVWLGVIAKDLYRKQLGFFISENVIWPAAIIFYLLFVVGVLFFAVFPALEKDSLANAAILGGLFGLFTYATYDLTNYATVKNWPLLMVGVDIVWGIVLTTIVATSGFLIAKWLM